MTEPEKTRRGLEALQNAMTRNQCYACSHEFVIAGEEFGTNILGNTIKRLTPKQIETEGGGSTWWHVCPECHGAVDSEDHFCRHCGQALEH
jgi:hypothetical protein